MEKGLEEKTGHKLDYWIEIVKKAQIEKHKAIIDFLKQEHGFTYGFANFVALKARKADAGSAEPEDLLKDQYAGKEHLKEIYDRLLEVISGFGNDLTISPKKHSVSLIRKKQFALVKPATKSRVDLGLQLKTVPITERLESSGPFGSMCSHRVRLTSVADVDDELIAWIRKAYEMSV